MISEFMNKVFHIPYAPPNLRALKHGPIQGLGEPGPCGFFWKMPLYALRQGKDGVEHTEKCLNPHETRLGVVVWAPR